MTTEQINDIRYALNVADIDDNKAWDALNALLSELDAVRAREAKLREALEQALTFHQVTHIHAVLRAALAEGEDTREAQ